MELPKKGFEDLQSIAAPFKVSYVDTKAAQNRLPGIAPTTSNN